MWDDITYYLRCYFNQKNSLQISNGMKYKEGDTSFPLPIQKGLIIPLVLHSSVAGRLINAFYITVMNAVIQERNNERHVSLSMRARNEITSILLIAISIGILMETAKMPIGNLKSPQAGFFPLILGILLGILAIILLIQTIKGRIKEKFGPWAKAGGLEPLCLTLVALFIFGIVFEKLGYLATTFIFITFLAKFISRFKWPIVIIFAFLSTLVSYILFGILLNSQLPMGIFDIILQN